MNIIGIHKITPRKRAKRYAPEKALNSMSSRVAPSLLSADFTRLADEMERFKASGAQVLHLLPVLPAGHMLQEKEP